MKGLMVGLALVSGAAMAQMEAPVAVLFEDGTEVPVPEGEKAVFVRDDANMVCLEVEFLELVMPAKGCEGLRLSPGCDD